MKRLTVFVKGNLDVHDSLHSCVIGGALRWNGINEVLRRRHPGTSIRLKHETWTRSDALLAATGAGPAAWAARDLALGSFPLASQFSDALFDAPADAYVLSIQPDASIGLFQHRKTGLLFYPEGVGGWAAADRAWLATAFEPLGMLAPAESMANFERIIARIRARSEAPILIYNMSPVVPGETLHCLRGFEEGFATRVRRFNLALAELSARTGISIIDIDTLLARAGADRLKLDALHLTPEGHALVAAEVARVLADDGLFDTGGAHAEEGFSCMPA